MPGVALAVTKDKVPGIKYNFVQYWKRARVVLQLLMEGASPLFGLGGLSQVPQVFCHKTGKAASAIPDSAALPALHAGLFEMKVLWPLLPLEWRG